MYSHFLGRDIWIFNWLAVIFLAWFLRFICVKGANYQHIILVWVILLLSWTVWFLKLLTLIVLYKVWNGILKLLLFLIDGLRYRVICNTLNTSISIDFAATILLISVNTLHLEGLASLVKLLRHFIIIHKGRDEPWRSLLIFIFLFFLYIVFLNKSIKTYFCELRTSSKDFLLGRLFIILIFTQAKGYF